MGAFSDALDIAAPEERSTSGRPRLVIYPNEGAAPKEKASPFQSALDNREARAPEAPKPEDAPALFTKRFEAIGPVETTNASQRLAINNQNEGDAAGQRTTPNTEAHRKNYISSDVYENDAGQLLYQDLDTGKLVPTDVNKHVVLRDPADNRLKVYGRDDNTNEGVASSFGRLLRLGATSNAPTAAVSDAAAATPLLTAAKSAPKAITPGQQVSAAAERLGVDVPRAVTSDNMATQWGGKLATNIPLAGIPLRKASENAISQLGTAAAETQQGYGSGVIPTAGASMRAGVENYVGNVTKARQNTLYGKVDALVDASKTSDLTATAKVAQTIADRRTNAAITAPSEAVKGIEDAVSRPGGLNYEGIKTLRTHIGEMMEGRSPLPANTSQSELKQIYKGLSEDLRTAAQKAGGDKAVEAFDRANKYTRLVSDRRENLMRVLNAKSDEGVFDKLVASAGSTSRADMTLLRQARKAVDPETWNELSSGVISKLGRDPNNNFSPDRFMTQYGKLTPEAKTLLFRSTGRRDLANSLDDIAKVSERFKDLNKFANPSGSGQTAIGAAEIAGFIHAPLTTLGTIVGGTVLSHILSLPVTAASTARWTKAYELAVVKPTTLTADSFRQASKVLAANIGREASRPDLVPELTRQLQNAAQARADNNKKP